MGLFVVGRMAARHGIRVGLRGSTIQEAGSGTTAEIYLPATVLGGTRRGVRSPAADTVHRPVATARASPAAEPAVRRPPEHAAHRRADRAQRLGRRPEPPVTPVAAPQSGIQRHHRRSAQAPEPPPRSAASWPRPACENGEKRLRNSLPAQAGFGHLVVLRLARSRHAADQADTAPAEPARARGCQPDPHGQVDDVWTAEAAAPLDRAQPTTTDLPADALRMAGRPARSGATAPIWIGSRCGTAAGRWPPRPRTSPSSRARRSRPAGARTRRPAGAGRRASGSEQDHRARTTRIPPIERRIPVPAHSRSTRPRCATPRRFAPPSAAISAACAPDDRMPATPRRLTKDPMQ